MKRILQRFRMLGFGFSKQLFFSYVIILSITLLLFSVVLYAGLTDMLKNRLVQSSTETIRQAGLNLQQYMNDVETLMFNIAVNGTVQATLSDSSEKTDFETVRNAESIIDQLISVDVFVSKTGGVYLFAEGQDKYPMYRASYLRPEAGRSSKSAVFRAAEIREEDWYLKTLRSFNRVHWQINEQESGAAEGQFTASREILNLKNMKECIGVVLVLVPTERFENILKDISFGAEGTAYLIADDHVVGAKTPEEQEALKSALQQFGNGETSAFVKLSGKRCCVLQQDLGVENWKLVGVIPEKTMLLQFGIVRGVLIPALLCALFLALLIARFNAQHLSKPIRSVANAMRQFDHQRDFRFVVNRKDEIGILFLSYNRMMNHIETLLCEIKETENRKRQAELQALQAQINPHFLYNTLDCIKSMAYLEEHHDIAQMATALSDLFRISLNRGVETLPLRREIEHVQNYCNIQRFRNLNAFVFTTKVPEALLERTIIKLILQPLVENAIIHGLRGKKTGGEICVSAREEGQALVISVQDNGIGADMEYLNGIIQGEYTASGKTGSGYGLKNVDERLRIAYGDHSGLRYRDNPTGGVIAEIWIVQTNKEGELTDA